MKKRTLRSPSRVQPSVLRQLVELIPGHLVAKLARRHGVTAQARTFSAWSHVVALVYAQFAHAFSLNDVCDGLRLWRTPLQALRGASPPSRNALSHANRTRACGMAEDLFWAVLKDLQGRFPLFAQPGRPGFAWRFRRTLHAVDSTVIQLLSSCLDWARHNRRKAAARLHLRLDVRSLLPGCVVIDSARVAELARVRQLCAGVKPGEIVLCDRGYQWFAHFYELTARGVYFVTRERPDLRFTVKLRRPVDRGTGILADEEVVTAGAWVQGDYPARLRRVEAEVEIAGQRQTLVFLTNNFAWSPRSIAELYRCRWQIEAFFKQLKQTLQLADFLGHNANAVRWQLWMALLVYVLLRFQAWRSQWAHSFARLYTLLRAALWLRWDVATLLARCGTAPGRPRGLPPPFQSWLPGFAG